MRALIVDDDALMREALHMFLTASDRIEVVGTGADGVEAVALAEELHPNVVLLDVQMPRMDGIATTRELVRRFPEVRILVVSSFATDRYVIDALRAGASGYVVKDSRPKDLVDAVLAVAAGEETISPAVVHHLVKSVRDQSPQSSPRPPELVDRHLSEREREVITMLASGNSNKEIADALFVSEATVKSHLSRIMAKFGVRDRVQTVIRAHQWGLAELHLDD